MTDIVSRGFNPGNTENSTASIRWNKFHRYNVGRAYGTLKWELPNAVGMTDIVSRDFNPGT